MTDDESDYEIEYEVLSRGSNELWDHAGDSGVSSDNAIVVTTEEGFVDEGQIRNNQDLQDEMVVDEAKDDASTSKVTVGASRTLPNDAALAASMKAPNTQNTTAGNQYQKHKGDTHVDQVSISEAEVLEERGVNVTNATDSDEEANVGFEGLERLMCEIGNMRNNLRLMPNMQSREMVAMFGESSDEDGF